MQISKAGVVAAGALATVAVMGSSAAAAPAAGSPHADAIATPATTLKLTAGQRVLPVVEQPAQPLISIGGGSLLTAAAWQICGSTAVAGLGASAPMNSPNTVSGDCTNANVVLRQDQVPGVISILDDTSVNLAPWQLCGANTVAGVGATNATSSPNTVGGTCANANTLIIEPYDTGPRSLLSVGSGSAVSALAWQICGSTAIAGVGAAVGLQSPTTVGGSCYNSNTAIQKRETDAVIPLLNNVGLDILPLQACEGEGLLGFLVGAPLPIDSPSFVGGECASPQVLNIVS